MSKFAIGDRVNKATNEHEGGVVVARTFARKIEFLEVLQSDLSCPVLSENIFHFARRANHLYKPAPSCPTRGAARDRHETRGGMRWTRTALLTRAQPCGRRSRVGPVPPILKFLQSSPRFREGTSKS